MRTISNIQAGRTINEKSGVYDVPNRKMMALPSAKGKCKQSPAQTELQEKFLELYKQGMNDCQIAKAAFSHSTTVYRWRKKNNLPDKYDPTKNGKKPNAKPKRKQVQSIQATQPPLPLKNSPPGEVKTYKASPEQIEAMLKEMGYKPEGQKVLPRARVSPNRSFDC